VTGNVEIYSDRTTGTTANAQLRLAQGASLSAANFNNFGVVSAESATLSGNFVNAGTIVVDKDSTLKIASGSTFTNGNIAENLAGTLDLSAANSAIDFSQIADESNIELKNGVVRINSVNLQKGEALPILGIDDKTIFDGLKIEDVNSYSLENRFVWDASAGELIFLGLNGERFRGTLYGDLQRESINATYDFMRAAQFRNGTRILTPELYGAYKLQSPYMRGYIEKVRQRGGEVSAQLEAKRKRELEMAEKLNSRLVNFWAQADFSDGNQRSRKGFDGYDSTCMNILVGASMPLKNWELGLALSGGDENYEMDSAGTRHEVDTTATGLTGYAQYKNDWFDCTFGAAGMMTSSDTDRGEYSGDFNGWRAGAMTELGVTLRAQSWFALHTFVGLSAAYAHSGSFSESGGEGALSVDSDGAASVRTTVGTSAAFLLTDTLQLKVHAAWLVDFGNDTCSLDAYMPSTRTDYVIDSRENESSLLEAGATLNWAFSENMEVFLGYTGTIGAGERVNAASLGLNYFF
ncbi:MAG: autotransporter domain-containing protein, partial [Opitutales bacterium]|nr:autotransporter domain-containing protein [Opitutales bacterium]